MLRAKEAEVGDIVKTGRTHLMDAMPVTFGQELAAGARRSRRASSGSRGASHGCCSWRRAARPWAPASTRIRISARGSARNCAEPPGLPSDPNVSLFEALRTQDTAVELSGQLKTLAVSLMKIANDLRWMNSGPLAGLGEIALPALQPGSSIMPGKVNPVIPGGHRHGCGPGDRQRRDHRGRRAVGQLPAQRHAAGDRLQAHREHATARQCRRARWRTSAHRRLHRERARLDEALERNPILVTALNPVIGYEKGAAIAKKAYAEGKPILEVAAKKTDLSPDELKRLLDPRDLARGGIKGGTSGGG